MCAHADPREARIHGLDRTGGPINGSTLVTIRGKLFSDFSLRTFVDREHVLRCRFGSAGESLAIVLGETEVQCLSPHIYGIGHQQAVSVDLTLNGQDYLQGNFKLVPIPSAGSECLG